MYVTVFVSVGIQVSEPLGPYIPHGPQRDHGLHNSECVWALSPPKEISMWTLGPFREASGLSWAGSSLGLTLAFLCVLLVVEALLPQPWPQLA